MINKKLFLNNDFESGDRKSTRDGFGDGLLEAGSNPDLVVLTADLGESTRADKFKEKYPDRFFDVGVAEQNLANIASGMAAAGKLPVISSFAVFSPGRNWEQIRTTIALNNRPVVIASSHAGLTVGEDGATHQCLEDIALMRTLPNMRVIVPCDYWETKKAVGKAVDLKKPVYIRFERQKAGVLTTKKTPFEIGRTSIFWQSKNPIAAVFASGPVIENALLAAKELERSAIEVNVINLSSIKPIDREVVVNQAKITGSVVTVENHQIIGGVGSAVAEVLGQSCPVPIEFVGVNDKFGQSGKPEELLEKYNLGKKDIIKAVKKVITRKNY